MFVKNYLLLKNPYTSVFELEHIGYVETSQIAIICYSRGKMGIEGSPFAIENRIFYHVRLSGGGDATIEGKDLLGLVPFLKEDAQPLSRISGAKILPWTDHDVLNVY